MRKITLCLMLILALIIVPGAIFATEGTVEVDTYQELVDALADPNNTEITLTDTIEINSTVIIDGQNHTIKTADGVKSSFKINNTGDEVINVTFKNVTITNPSAESRCINTRTDKINLTLDNVKLQTTSAQNNQPLTIGGTETGGLTVKMINSSATSAGKAGYGLITFVPANITIEDSDITGYAALYVKPGSAGLKVDVINSTLIGENNNTGSDDSFATIVVDESDVIINVSKNSIIRSTGNGQQTLVADRSTGSEGNTIDISSATIDANGPFAYVTNTNTKLSVGVGVTSNVNVSEYLSEDVAIEYDETTGKFKIVERTIKVEGLENVVDTKEAEKVLLDSFNEWVKENPEEAKNYANTNITIEIDVIDVSEEDIGNMPLSLWEEFVEALNKKDANAKMTKKFVAVSVSAGNDGMGFNLTELVKPITFKIDIPELEKCAEGYERKYYAVRARENATSSEEENLFDVLDAKESADGKSLEIATEGYSLYGIAYSDVEKPVVTPPADDDNTDDDQTVTPPAGDDNTDDDQTVTPPAGDEGEDVTPPTVEGGTGVAEPEEEPKEETTTPDVPQTGDNVVVYAVFAVVAMVGIAVAIKMRKK